jgi:hypothetical protein
MPARPPRPSGSSTTPARATRSARCTTAPPRWTGWSRSRSGASRSPRLPPPPLDRHGQQGRPPRPDHRHPRPRGLHRRGGAFAAGARRRRRRVRRGGRRGAPDRDRVASGRQVPRAAHVLHQQDGPHRRRLLRRAGLDQGAPPRQGGRHPAADRLRGRVPGIVDLVTMQAWIWHGEELGANWDVTDIPADMVELADEYRQELIDVLSETDETVMEKFINEEELPRGDARRPARGHPPPRRRARAQRHRLQEQGCAAAAGRGLLLHAQPARPSAGGRHRPQGRADHPGKPRTTSPSAPSPSRS